jgi:ABC-type multidrug transport system ATPase subunit
MSAIALSIRGLHKSFARGLARCTHRTVAIAGVDLDLFQSEIVGLIGPEGAGKTTLLQCASGLLRPDSGYVLARHPVEYVPPIPIYYPFVTVRDVISFRASRVSMDAERTGEILDLLGLHRERNEIVATLSSSALTRLAIAEAVTSRPAAIMIDTTASRAMLECADVRRALERITSTGMSTLIAARDDGSVAAVARRVIRLTEGRVATMQTAPMFVAERLH